MNTDCIPHNERNLRTIVHRSYPLGLRYRDTLSKQVSARPAANINQLSETAYRTQKAGPTPRATLIKSTLIGDLLILLRKHSIKAALAALAHSRLN
jgi:hypothetical protein